MALFRLFVGVSAATAVIFWNKFGSKTKKEAIVVNQQKKQHVFVVSLVEIGLINWKTKYLFKKKERKKERKKNEQAKSGNLINPGFTAISYLDARVLWVQFVFFL